MYFLRILTLLSFPAWCVGFPTLIENINLATFDSSAVQVLSDANISYAEQYEFNHGMASGDPTNSSVILWTRVTPSAQTEGLVPVFVTISEHRSFETAAKFTVLTGKSVDYTIKVDVPNLKPDTKYYYQFFTMTGSISRVGSTRTLPAENALTEKVTFGVYSCSNYAGGFFTGYAMPALKESVDYVIHLGDYIYEYKNGKYTDGTALNRTHFPNKELYLLEDYRQRYASYRTDADLQLSHALFPWIVVWDDHELADNSWLRGSVNSQGIEYLERRKNFLQAYYEWMPIRPQPDLSKIWRQLRFGSLVDLLMIDTRHYSRDVTDTYDNSEYIASIADRPERTMMGFDQEQWLYSSLSNSKAAWKLIGSQTVVNSVSFEEIGEVMGPPFTTRNYDSFDGYTANRDRFIRAITDNNINDVLLLSGDFHISWVHEIYADESEYDLATGKGSCLVEFAVTGTSSPTTFPKHFSVEQCYDLSEILVSSNEGVLWNEGWFRGYSEVQVEEGMVEVRFYGVDVQNPSREEFLLATFAVDRGTNRVRRAFSDKIKYGYLDKALA